MTHLKKAKFLKIALLSSIALSTGFLFAKLIFYLVIIDKWQDTQAQSSIIVTLVTSLMIIVGKAVQYGPKIIYFHNLSKDKVEFDASLALRVKKFSKRILWAYLTTFLFDIFTLFRILDADHATLTIAPAIFSLVTVPLGAAITYFSYYISDSLLKEFERI